MRYDFSADPAQAYGLLTHTVIPRPIAWVLTRGPSGGLNLAPFSFFNVVASDPPVLAVSVGRRADGRPKDTWANVERTREAVVHLPSFSEAGAVTASAASLAPELSEIEALRLAVVEESGWGLPRLQIAQVAFSCGVEQIVRLGPGEGTQGLLLLRVREAWVDDAAMGPEGRPDPVRLDPLARLGGPSYASLGQTISIERPA